MLTSVAPNGTQTWEPHANEFFAVPIDDKWEPKAGDVLRHRDTAAVRKVKAVFRWLSDLAFTYESGGATYNSYPEADEGYSVKLAAFECLRPVEAVPPMITMPFDTPMPSVPPAVPSTGEMHQAIDAECMAIADMLQGKNRAYGNSIADPIKVFSKADADERINVRLDDKISRLVHGKPDDNEDTELDLIGYLILRRAKRRAQGKV